jgi:hypothetical protein
MLKLFTLADPRVSATTVKGDLIVDEQNRDRIMTRSRTRNAPDRYTQVPFPLKALKLLLKDVHGMQGGKKGGKSGAGLEGVAEDDGVSFSQVSCGAFARWSIEIDYGQLRDICVGDGR